MEDLTAVETGLHIVSPGERIAAEGGYLRGHGTYAEGEQLLASVAGVVERVNKLVIVRPLRSRYTGELGDVVVGRVRDVGSKRWRVDVGSRQDAVLMLSSVNLEGGEQRRRTYEDQMNMRAVYEEGDLLSAEVHSVFSDGSLSLHARSAKYGRLGNGVLVRAPPALVKRLRQHFAALECGVDAIFGMNGWIFITERMPSAASVAGGGDGDADASASLGLVNVASAGADGSDAAAAMERQRRAAAERTIAGPARDAVARVHNSIVLLVARSLSLSPDSVSRVVARSTALGLAAKDMLLPEHDEALLLRP